MEEEVRHVILMQLAIGEVPHDPPKGVMRKALLAQIKKDNG